MVFFFFFFKWVRVVSAHARAHPKIGQIWSSFTDLLAWFDMTIIICIKQDWPIHSMRGSYLVTIFCYFFSFLSRVFCFILTAFIREKAWAKERSMVLWNWIDGYHFHYVCRKIRLLLLVVVLLLLLCKNRDLLSRCHMSVWQAQVIMLKVTINNRKIL